MRIAALLVGLLGAGCGFSVSGGAAPSDGRADDSDVPDDTGDAPTDMEPDEPAPACPDGDDDLDTVCNSVDACDDHDDRLDNDLDHIPDGCDRWPCGVAPADPGEPVAWTHTFEDETQGITLSDTRIGGAADNLFVVEPGATFTVRADYAIFDCICTNCIDQIQVGLVPGDVKQCLYDGNPGGSSVSGCNNPTTGQDSMVTLTAPAQKGVYDLRFRMANANSCNMAPGWWTNEPPTPDQTFGKICVYAP